MSYVRGRGEDVGYLDGGGGVEHVLQTEVAAAVQVVFAEVLDQLHVVETIRQRHVLLQTDIWEERRSHLGSDLGVFVAWCCVPPLRMYQGAVKCDKGS